MEWLRKDQRSWTDIIDRRCCIPTHSGILSRGLQYHGWITDARYLLKAWQSTVHESANLSLSLAACRRFLSQVHGSSIVALSSSRRPHSISPPPLPPAAQSQRRNGSDMWRAVLNTFCKHQPCPMPLTRRQIISVSPVSSPRLYQARVREVFA